MSKNFRHHPHHHLNASALASWMTTLTVSSLLIKGVIPLLFVLLHCVMDELSMLLVTIPVLFPAAWAFPSKPCPFSCACMRRSSRATGAE